MSSFFKKYIIPITTTVLFLSLVGCGSGGSSDSSTKTVSLSDTNNSKEITSLKSTGTALTLSNADVVIYKVKNDGSLSLMWKEITTSGDRLKEIGEFNLHTDELTDDDFYLYKVTGGKDWDSNNDGILDENSTTNRGILRSIAQGVDIKKAGDNFKISYTTELFYEEVVPTLKRKFDRATFPSILSNKVSEIIEDSHDIQDILTFNPIEDKEKLKEFYKIRAKTIVDTIHQGKIPALNMSAILGSYNMVIGSSVEDVTLSSDGTKAYMADPDNGLIVIDISDSTNPTQLGSLNTVGYVRHITLSSDNTKAYVDGHNGLVVIDISDSYNPTQLGSLDMNDGYVNDITLSSDGTKAYVADGNSGLTVIDISNPTNPTQLSSYEMEEGFATQAITLSNNENKAYIIGRHSLVVLDISELTNPIQLGSYNTIGDAYAITISSDGSKAYVADGYNGLIVIDISNPTNLTKLSSFNTTGYATDVTLSSDDTKAYVADGNSGLVVIDISDSANPIKIGSNNILDGYIQAVKLSKDDTKAYASTSQGLVVIDISRAINPPKVSSYGTTENSHSLPSTNGTNNNMARLVNTLKNLSPILGTYSPVDGEILNVAVSNDGTKVYVENSIRDLNNSWNTTHSLVAIDISDSTNPTQLGSINTYNTSFYTYYPMGDIVLSNDGTKAYVSDNNGLAVIDISNSTNPTQLGTFNIKDGFARDITLSIDGTKAYVADENNGLLLIDISNSANLIQLASYDVNPAYVVTLSSDDTKAYVESPNTGGLLIMDISNPTNPTQLSSLNTDFLAQDIVLSNDGSKAYISYFLKGLSLDFTGNQGFTVFDISNPTNPTRLDSLYFNSNPRGITLSKDGRKAYVANGTNGLVVIDISNPTNLTQLGSYDTEGSAEDVSLSSDGTKAYVADKGNGLVVIDLDLYN